MTVRDVAENRVSCDGGYYLRGAPVHLVNGYFVRKEFVRALRDVGKGNRRGGATRKVSQFSAYRLRFTGDLEGEMASRAAVASTFGEVREVVQALPANREDNTL